MTVNEQIGKKIRNLRKEKGLTQTEIADKFNLSQNAITNIETGKRELKIDELLDFASFFGVSTDYLIKENGVRGNNPELQYICDYLGISEDTINLLVDRKEEANFSRGFMMIAKEDRADIIHDFIEFFIKKIEPYLDSVLYYVNKIDIRIEEHSELREELTKVMQSIIEHPASTDEINIEDFGCVEMFLGYAANWYYDTLLDDFTEKFADDYMYLNSHCFVLQNDYLKFIDDIALVPQLRKKYDLMNEADNEFYNNYKWLFGYNSHNFEEHINNGGSLEEWIEKELKRLNGVKCDE